MSKPTRVIAVLAVAGLCACGGSNAGTKGAASTSSGTATASAGVTGGGPSGASAGSSGAASNGASTGTTSDTSANGATASGSGGAASTTSSTAAGPTAGSTSGSGSSGAASSTGNATGSCLPDGSYAGPGNASSCCSAAVDASDYCADLGATTATTGANGSSGTTGDCYQVGSFVGVNDEALCCTGIVDASGYCASAGSGTTGGDGGQACASSSVRAQAIPLDIYIMLDQSSSMGDSTSGGATKWQAVTDAISSFVNQPGLDGISVGLQYFALPPSHGITCPSSCDTPEHAAACETGFGICANGNSGTCYYCDPSFAEDSCYSSDYATPEIEIAPLPGVATDVNTSLGQHQPVSGTPTSAALLGALGHASSWASAHAGEAVITVLATDGEPSECDTNQSDINAIAASGYASNPSIRTFVIGVGSSLSALNGVAAAGGTGAAFIVDTSRNVNQQFLDALNTIRGTALGCQYSIPHPAHGQVDLTRVNVAYTPGGSSTPQTIGNVPDAASCPANGDAWYYNDPVSPTQIVLCPRTCDVVSADTSGEVDVVTGCQTVITH
jgi:hypothetical protein